MSYQTPYLHFYSSQTIQDQFIDECLEFDLRQNKQDHIQTGIKPSSEKFITFNEIGSEKSLGRWTIEESFIYLDVIKNYFHTKIIVKILLERLPQRIESQIRAHHQKMIKKYGSRQEIIRCSDRQQNFHLMEINKRLSSLEWKLLKLCNSTDDFPK